MIKKALYSIVALGLVASFIFGRDTLSYMRTFGQNIRETVKSEIDLDIEVDRARQLVEELDPEIRSRMSKVAEQQVEIRELADALTDKELALRTQKDAILAMRDDLKSGDEKFVYASMSYSRNEVEQDLRSRLNRFKAAEAVVNHERQILAAHREQLNANQEVLEGMLDQKQQLEVGLAQLEARLKQVEAAETVAAFKVDDTCLARARELIRDVNRQLDVKQSLLDTEGQFGGLIPWDGDAETDSGDIAAEIDNHFGEDAGADAEVALKPAA